MPLEEDDARAIVDRIDGRPSFAALLRAAAEGACEVRIVPRFDERTGNLVFLAEVEGRLSAGPEAGAYLASGTSVIAVNPASILGAVP